MSNAKGYTAGSFGSGFAVISPDSGSIVHAVLKAVSFAASRFTGYVSGFGESIARSFRIRRTYETLASLDDRMLKDIGISRSDIASVALHSVDYPGIRYPGREK